jgi:hypothetical protein
MGNIDKVFSLFIFGFLAVLSLMIVETAGAQTKPSIPEFSITVETQQTVTVTIKNSYNYYTFYNIRAKDHFSDNWTEFFDAHTYTETNPRGYISPSNTENTTINLQINYAPGSQVDFQTEAIQWGPIQVWVPESPYPWDSTPAHYEQRISYYGTSGWGNTQTITIPETSTSPTHAIPEFSWLIIPPVFLSIISFVVLIRKQKVCKKSLTQKCDSYISERLLFQ